MANDAASETMLYSLYAQFVGEPQSTSEVYGYWIFILGYIIGAVGIVAFVLGAVSSPEPVWVLRETAFSLAALALPLALGGIVLLLPVHRRGIQAAVLGNILAVVGVAWFVTLYPFEWSSTNPNLPVVAVYGVGVAIIAGVAALIPVATGQRSALADQETENEAAGDQSEVLLGETLRGALFAVFKMGDSWTWRLVEEKAMADTPDQYLTRLETEDRVDSVRTQIAEAGMLEIKGAAFRLYETDGGFWRWVLMQEGGDIMADGGDDSESRDAAEQSVDRLKQYGPDAEPLVIDGAAVDYDRDGGRWQWYLVDEARNELAASPDAYTEKGEAVATADSMRDAVTDAEILRVDDYGVELYRESSPDAGTEQPTEADGGVDSSWRWRMIDDGDSRLVDGTTTYESRNAAERAVHNLLGHLGNAPVLEAGEPVYKIVSQPPDGWGWRLVGTGATTVARGYEDGVTQEAARQAAKTVKATAESADVFVIDGTSFEVYTDGDGWRWRLVDEHRTVIAVGDEHYQTRERAEEAVETVRDQVPEAELIEFDTAAFQIYEAGDRPTDSAAESQAEWRWRLIDEDGDVLADSGDDYGTRSQALDSMTTLKQYAPNAELLEIDTAAFELYADDQVWYWRLIDENGTLIARAGDSFPSRQAARASMDRLIENAADTESRFVDSARFQVYGEGDAWHWRFLRPDDEVLAVNVDAYATRDQAVAAIRDCQPDASRARVTVLENLAISIAESEGTLRWEIVDAEMDRLAEGTHAYTDRRELDREVDAIRRRASDIDVFEFDGFVFWLRQDGAGWSWRLVDEDRLVVAESAAPSDSEEAARRAIDRVRRLAPGAGSIDYDDAAFDIREGEDGWQWRLVDEDERVIASATDAYESRDRTIEELESIKDVVGSASILEFDTAAFELQETDDGWRWRLVDDRGDVVGRSLSSYPDRSQAREAMRTAKEVGPDARTAVAEYE